MSEKNIINNYETYFFKCPKCSQISYISLKSEIIKKRKNYLVNCPTCNQKLDIFKNRLPEEIKIIKNNKNEFKHASLEYFEKNKDTITDKEADIWDFMATSKIESMTYKDGEKDAITIKLNSLMFR